MNQGQPSGSGQQGLVSARRRSEARWELKSRVALTATSELSYAEEMDQRQDALSPIPLSSPPTDGSYRTPPVEESTHLVPIPEDMQLPSPTSSEEVVIPIPPLHATTLGHVVSGQRCWTRRKIDQAPGTGASGHLFWRTSGLRGKDRACPYPAGRGEIRGSAGDWQVRVVKHLSPSKPGPSSPREIHAPFHSASSQALPYGWKSLSPGRSPRD